MNKLRKISIITIILYCFLISVSYAATGTVNVSAARLREEANTTSNILTNIYRNEKVEILELEGEWYKVKYGNNIGYLKKDLIKEDEVEKSENNNVSTYNQNANTIQADESKIITSSSAKVRIVPNIMSKVSVEVESGKELTKISEMGNWLKVTDGSFSGWILKNKTTTPTVQTQVNATDFENDKNQNNIQEKKQDDNKQNKKEDEEKKNNQNITAEDTSTQESVKKQDNLATSVNKKGVVNVETAKVRESASPKAKVIGFLDYNDVIEISEEEGEWYKFTEKSISGYVHKTLITISDNEKEITSRGKSENRGETKKEEANTDNTTIDSNSNNVTDTLMSSNSQAVVDYAKQYLGYSYVVGGKNPTTGFDCSGFTRYVFLNFGYSLGATAATQNDLGTEISKENLQAGDLLIFYDEGKNKIGHTGIYISDGDFIHAANPSRGVVIDNLNTNSYYRERFIIGRRIVE